MFQWLTTSILFFFSITAWSHQISHQELQVILQSKTWTDTYNLNPEEVKLYIEANGVNVNTFSKSDVIGKYETLYQGKPTIFVTDLNDKWTLLHEFLHFLIEKERLANDPEHDSFVLQNQRNAREDFLETYPTFRASKNDPRPWEIATTNFISFMKFETLLIKQMAVEEISIESLLSDLYEKNQISHLTAEQYQVAQKYIASNQSTLENSLKVFFEIEADLRAHAPSGKAELLDETYVLLSSLRR